ncbi:MAG TPA: efflux RND transporter periplasmic adaptor subunit [Gemmatimonadaceae bacterium]|nr:efflux RND transporter periplasmic adaptor subunit [Gemmatimonadaceae bacterium]
MASCLALASCAKLKADAAADTSSAAGDSSASAAAAGDSAKSGGGGEGRAVLLPVVGEEARDGDLVLTVATTGQVRSDAESKLKAEVAGTVEEVLARPGDRVRRGQPLVRLDPRPFDLAVREAESAVDQAELQSMETWLADSLATGKGPPPDRRRYAQVRAGLPAAKVRLEKARLERERSTIVAPFDGVVDRLDVSAGERVQPGQAITAVVDLRNLRVEASVLEHDLPLIRVGGRAVVTSAAAPDRAAEGRVTAVLPLVDSATRAGRAFVRVAAPSSGGASALRPGMYADVRLEATRLPGRRLVPARAVIERDGRPLVFVVKGGRAQWVYVTPGRTNGAETEILPDSSTGAIPVEAGDTVITDGHLTLAHDARVRVVAKKDKD